MKNKLLLLALICCAYLNAQDTVKVATNLSPDQQAELDYNNGLAALTKKEFLPAVDLFTKCLAVKPTFDKALSNRAIAYVQLKNTDAAIADINAALKINASADTYFNKALIFMNLNKKDSQNVALDNCLKQNPNHAEANYYKGLSNYEVGDYDKAIDCYSKSISTNPNYVYAYNDRASAKRAKKDYPGAITDYEKAISIDSKLTFVHNNLGSCYRLNKNYDKAVAAYTKALETDQNYLTALINRGAANFDNGKLPEAQNDFEAVLKKDPQNSFAYNNLASIAIKSKDYKKAKDLAGKAIDLDAKNGPAYYNRGIARQMLREEEASCADWKKAVELGVENAKLFVSTNCD